MKFPFTAECNLKQYTCHTSIVLFSKYLCCFSLYFQLVVLHCVWLCSIRGSPKGKYRLPHVTNTVHHNTAHDTHCGTHRRSTPNTQSPRYSLPIRTQQPPPPLSLLFFLPLHMHKHTNIFSTPFAVSSTMFQSKCPSIPPTRLRHP